MFILDTPLGTVVINVEQVLSNPTFGPGWGQFVVENDTAREDLQVFLNTIRFLRYETLNWELVSFNNTDM